MERTLGGRPGIPVRPVKAARVGVLHRHAAAHRVRVAARRARVLLHARGHRRPLPADERQGGLLPARLGRQRAADRAAGAERLRRALRPVGAVRPVVRAAGRSGRARPRYRSPGATSSTCASGSPRSTSAPSRTCGGASAFPWTGRCSTRRSATTRGGCRSGRSCTTSAGARRTGPRRPRSGTSRSRRRSPRRSLRTATTPARSTGSPSTAPDRRPGLGRDHAARAAARLRRAGRAPGRRAVPGAVRRHRADAGVRRRGARLPAPARRAGQGVGHRDGVHLRRPDRRDLVAGARPAHAGDHRAERPAAGRPAGRGARRAVRRTGRARPCSPPARAWSSCCGKAATWTASRGR